MAFGWLFVGKPWGGQEKDYQAFGLSSETEVEEKTRKTRCHCTRGTEYSTNFSLCLNIVACNNPFASHFVLFY